MPKGQNALKNIANILSHIYYKLELLIQFCLTFRPDNTKRLTEFRKENAQLQQIDHTT